MKKIEQAVILAGGFGTRLKPFTDTNPKPMYPIGEKPFLEYLIRQVKEFGITDVLLLLGYMPEKIMDYFGSGEGFGVNIDYDVTPVEYETGKRLKSAQDKLQDAFLLMYCDNFCPINYNKLYENFVANDAMIQITAYRNSDGYTKSNLRIDTNGLVKVYDKQRKTLGLEGVDIGYALVKKETLSLMNDDNENFEKIVYAKLVENKQIYATVTEHRYYSIGSYERIELTKLFFSDQKYVFLDRDGTLNKRAPQACYIENAKDFVWLDGAREAVKKLKEEGYFIILISNQPGIARGNLTLDDLESIHQKMQKDLQEVGANIDAIYYCPHNWDEGCECRKPKPGMFYKAQRDFSINLTKCYMMGDDERDMDAAREAGCKTMFVDENNSLLNCVDKLIKMEREKA